MVFAAAPQGMANKFMPADMTLSVLTICYAGHRRPASTPRTVSPPRVTWTSALTKTGNFHIQYVSHFHSVFVIVGAPQPRRYRGVPSSLAMGHGEHAKEPRRVPGGVGEDAVRWELERNRGRGAGGQWEGPVEANEVPIIGHVPATDNDRVAPLVNPRDAG